MRLTHTMSGLALLAAITAAAPVTAQDFSWHGRVASGKAIEIVGINGEIDAVAGSGDEVTVTAEKRGRRSNPEDVKIEVVPHDGGVTICAVYPSAPGRRPNECRPHGEGRNSSHNNDVRVNFRVEVPPGVNFVGRTVNGAINATHLSGDIQAHTVNGDVDVSASGMVEAHTVNGSIDASLGRADWSGDLEFESVNGSITITLPDDLNTEVHASTVNGGISTDWPLTVRGRFGPKRVSGTIGNGGRQLSLTTVNGSIDLRKK